MPIPFDTPVLVDGALMRVKRTENGSAMLQRWHEGAWRKDGGVWPAGLTLSPAATPEELRSAGVPETDWIGTPHTAG